MSCRPVSEITVRSQISQLMNGQRYDLKAMNCIFESKKGDQWVVGTDGDDWKPIVEKHVQNWIAEQEARESTYSQVSESFDDLSDKKSFVDLHAANLV